MGAKQSRLSDEDFLFLEEETGMSKATLQVGKFRPEHKMIKFRPEHKMIWSVQSLFCFRKENLVYIYRCGTPTSWKTAQVESSLRRNSSKSMPSWQRSSQGNSSPENIWCSAMFWNKVLMVLVLRGKGRDSFTKNLFTTFDTDNSGTIDFRWNQWKFEWSGLC